MKIVEFKFSLRDAVTFCDGKEGRVCQLIYDASGNKYEVAVKLETEEGCDVTSVVVREEELLLGHNLFFSSHKK